MVRVADVVEPRAGSAGRFDEPYLRLVDEWEQRGWLAPDPAAHARKRTSR
jgi:hypothetical protein